jgi:hypothetical protein
MIRLLRIWKDHVKHDQHDVLLSSHPYHLAASTSMGALNQTSQEQRSAPESVASQPSLSFSLDDVMFDLPLSWLLSKSAREDLKAQVTETRDVGTGAFTNKTNLQPDSPSNLRAFEAELCTLYSRRIPEAPRQISKIQR